ncbi:MAG: response regulator [Bacteroidota bacterium]
MKKILIVDDEFDTCYLLSRMLKHKSFDVEYATTLTDARTCITQYRPDIILLDNNLPDGLGMDFINYAVSNLQVVSVVMMTTTVDDAFKLEAAKRGACDFISKPLSADMVYKVIYRLF